PSPPATAPPQSFLARFLENVRGFLGKAAAKPKTGPENPRRWGAAGGPGTTGPLVDRGGGAAPGDKPVPTLPRIPDVPGDGPSIKKGASGMFGSGASPDKPGTTAPPLRCAPPTQPLRAGTRTQPERFLCLTVPDSKGKPTKAQLQAVLERVQGIGRLLDHSAMRPGLDALQAAVVWSSKDVADSQVLSKSFDQSAGSVRALFAQSNLAEARKTSIVLDELDDWLAKDDGPSNGLVAAAERLEAAGKCLKGPFADLPLCHDEHVVPGLGRALRFQSEQMSFLRDTLKSDKDLQAALAALKKLDESSPEKPASAPEHALYAKLKEFLENPVPADAAKRLERATGAWDSFASNPGTEFASEVQKELDAFKKEVAALGEIGAYGLPNGLSLFMSVQATQFALEDSAVGWKQSTKADSKPIDRTEGAVDGSKGAVEAMRALADSLGHLKAMVAAQKD
ncbi:MAG: hypothetical protein HY925_09000, partial [Elusimicrobia bacterium]|nr:hypothetical protein [Elusimicrobiota bacterium]